VHIMGQDAMYQSTNSDMLLSPQDLVGCPLHVVDLDELQKQLDSPHKIAIARMVSLGVLPPTSRNECSSQKKCICKPIDGGLAAPLVELLSQTIDTWMRVFTTHKSTLLEEKKELLESFDLKIVDAIETKRLHQVLSLHLDLSKADATLAEEIAKGCGSHRYLSKLICMDIYSILLLLSSSTQEQYEQAEDVLIEMQDLACKVAHSVPSIAYPAKLSPYAKEELQARLPLMFDICSPNGNRESLMVQQVTERQSAQEDVGFVMWPSAVVLSSWLLDHPSLLDGKSILEIGSGCGLTGLVAARMAKAHTDKNNNAESHSNVILSDFNHKVLTNIQQNLELNGLQDVAKALHLDFYLQDGTNTEGGWKGVDYDSSNNYRNQGIETCSEQPAVDLILAADTICKPSDSIAVSNTIHDALVPGGEAIVVSANAKHRFGIDIFEKECARNGLQVLMTNVADMCDGKLLPMDKDSIDPCGIRQTSGFVDGMTLTMFRVRKPAL